MSRKRVLITGVTGQDGSFLAERLLAEGHEVHGLVRRASSFNTGRIDHLYRDPHDPSARLRLHFGDVLDASTLLAVVSLVEPDEIYHLAAQSHVRVSFDVPVQTGDVTALGTLRLLEVLRALRYRGRFVHASSSEMFGNAPCPQDESTPHRPRSPYGAAKAYAHAVVVNYRDAHGLFAANAIMFNHESERRGETFVTRKITRAVGRIRHGLQEKVYVGNLDAARDWGHAEDSVDALVRIARAERPDDFVVATGHSHTVREFTELAFARAGLRASDHVVHDPRYLRATEIDRLEGDARRLRETLGWAPRCDFETLVARMVDHDLALAAREAHARG